MKSKAVSLVLIFTLILTSFGTLAASAQSTAEPDILHDIFSGIDDVDSDAGEDRLPYSDGTVLSDIREPLGLSDSGAKIFGEDNSSSENPKWNNIEKFKLKTSFSVGGTTYTANAFKILASCEGDFDGDGKRSEIAAVVAAKTNDNKSLLLLCTAEAKSASAFSPVAVLYSGTAKFYDNTGEFANCIDIVCADVNGDGYDEIATATPTSGFASATVGEYGFDKSAGAYLWYKNNSDWCGEPYDLRVGMNMAVPDCHLGAPGTTASLAAGDVDGDGYDDIVSAISTTKAQYNSNYSSNMFCVYYIGGAPQFDDMYYNRKLLTNYLPGDVNKDLGVSITSGNASGFDAAICDVDGSGKPTIFLSMKKTLHHYSGFNGNRMLTPSFYVIAFDYASTDSGFKFISSKVLNEGIYHSGWLDAAHPEYSDTDYVYRTKVSDCAPVRIGVLKGDFGLSDGKKGYASSGTLVADQRYYSFVRYADGNTYRYDIKNSGLFTGSAGQLRQTNGMDFDGANCVFYNNGINVTDIRTANVSFDGKKYADAALVKAYTDGGWRTYFLAPSANGYTASTLSDGAPYAATAMPDTDSDSIRLKYNKHVFFWSDPVVIAALASPPYFDSLPSEMYTNSQTTYGKSISTSEGKSESYTVSAGAYISTEVKAGSSGVSAVFESESEAMRSDSKSDERTTEVSYTQSFSATGGEDTVVLTTVGYDAYAYTAYYPGADGGTAETPYVVFVPRGGSDAIKIATLNYEDYLEFIPYAKGTLPELKDVFTHTVGKPETYPHTSPSGSAVLGGSIMEHPKLSGFPSNTGSNTLSIDITNETTQTTSSGSSVSAKLGGGIEAEAEGIFNMVDMGTKVTGGYVSEKEYECGRIKTNAVGTSFEGTVFGQGDGMNVSGSGEKRAYFNWRLLHYIHSSGEKNDLQQFPVVTYITSGVIQPEGVVPTSVTVSPPGATVEQVGPKTEGYVNTASFTVTAKDVTREAYTALEGAPVGMTLDTGGSNISVGTPYAFGIKINGNVQPGKYALRLNVGGVLSDPFTVNVTEYEVPHWIEAQSKELDFGSMRFNYGRGTPAAPEQTVTVKNIHTEQVKNLTASLDEDSPFEITTPLSSSLLYAKGLDNSAATIGIRPKSGLSIGEHTGTLTVTNGITAAFVDLKYTVTNPTKPGAPSLSNNFPYTPNPIKVYFEAPKDDGGGQMLHYLYTILGHEKYMQDGEQVWAKHNSTIQSGTSTEFTLPDTLTVGEKYTLGMKAVTTAGEGDAAWWTFEVSESENNPDPAKNLKAYVSDGTIAVTWESPGYWGENKYVSDIPFKFYRIYLNDGTTYRNDTLYDGDELKYVFTGLENGRKYTVELYTHTTNRSNYTSVTATPKDEVTTALYPSNLKADMSYKKAKLTWEAPIFDGGADVTAYKVSKDGGATWINVGNAEEYTFENLVTNREYNFKVCAVNSAGDGIAASVTETAPSSLGVPAINNVIRGNGQLELDWEPANDSKVTGYQVRLDDGEWIDAEPIVFDRTLHYIFDGLENDREYALSVRYVDAEGPGPSKTQKRKPSSLAPLGVKNARVEPKNGGMKFLGDVPGGVYLEYKVDGDRMWWSTHSGAEMYGYENGKTYTVALATTGRDEYGLELRTASYFTVTPDAALPSKPSAPVVKASVNGNRVKLSWTADDNGAPITSYTLLYGSVSEITFPSEVNSFEVTMSEQEFVRYRKFIITASNSEGDSTGEIYVEPGVAVSGDDGISLAENYTSGASGQYKLLGRDWDYENEKYIDCDISGEAEWSIKSPSDKITWNNAERRLSAAKGLSAGEYNVTVCAERYDVTFEYNVKVTVGGVPTQIVSAEKTANGVNVRLSLSPSVGSALLCVASYDSGGNLADTVLETVSSGGEVSVSVKTGAKIKVMLLDKTANLKPLCKSKFAN